MNLFCPVHFPSASRNLDGLNLFGSGKECWSMPIDERLGMTMAPFGMVNPFHSTTLLKYLINSNNKLALSDLRIHIIAQ